MRTPVMAGNWKMYKNPADTRAFFQGFVSLVQNTGDGQRIVANKFRLQPPWGLAGEQSVVGIQFLKLGPLV